MTKQYPIDKIIVMTLERSVNRQWAFRGAAEIMEIDPDIIYYKNGIDNFDYGDNIKEVVKAAERDGFPFVADYADIKETKGKGFQQTAATVCQVWNYARVLRYLVEEKETALVIFDDKMITAEFEALMMLVSEVVDVKDEEFYALQLTLRGNLDEIELPELTMEQRTKWSHEVYRGLFGSSLLGSYREMFLRKGIAGYDETIVWSPEGAKWMLQCLEMRHGFYRYLDHFICQQLPEFAKQAIKRKKGIYCPSEIGYSFVRHLMSMGTTTDWATKESDAYEYSRTDTKLQYLDDGSDTSKQTTPSKSTTPQRKKSSTNPTTLQNQLKNIVGDDKNSETV